MMVIWCGFNSWCLLRVLADASHQLTDEVAQVHRSPGFITSNLVGKREDGVLIKEFEASHGTVTDLWLAHQRGEETSLNPLGMIEALVCAFTLLTFPRASRSDAVLLPAGERDGVQRRSCGWSTGLRVRSLC